MSSAEPPPGGNDAAPQSHRYFCRHCSTTVTIHPSAGSTLLCPICHQGSGLIQESDTPSSSSTATSRPLIPAAPPPAPSPPPTPGVITRRATFEIPHPTDTYVRVVSESNFFRYPLPDSAPILSPLPAAGSLIPFRPLGDFINHCLNEGAIITTTLLHNDVVRLFQNHFGLNLPTSAPRYDVALLPDVSMAEDLLLASGDAQCSVCLEDFEIGEVTKQLPCKHLYHRDCIARWLRDSDTCPICRLKLTTPSMASGASREQSFVTRFDVEMQWRVESSFSRFQSGSSEDGGGGGEGNGEDFAGNEPSTPEGPD